jgi:hypothetical protein
MIYEPRIGVVFTPFGEKKTVVRTGFGLFSNLPSASSVSMIFSNAPGMFTPAVTFGNIGPASTAGTSQAAAAASFQTFENSFNQGFTLSQIQAAMGNSSFAAPNYFQPQDSFKPPQVYEWSLEIEHPLTQHDVLAVTYSGNHGRYEPVNNTTLNDYINNTKLPTGFLGLPSAAPDPRFATVTQATILGYHNYDGVSVQVRHAMSRGFMGQIGYTWSHSLQFGTIYDPNNLRLGYGNSGLDTRHNLTADILWNMPRLKNSLLERAVGGWNVGAKVYAYSGRPFSVNKHPARRADRSHFQWNNSGRPAGPDRASQALHERCGQHSFHHAISIRRNFQQQSDDAEGLGQYPAQQLLGSRPFRSRHTTHQVDSNRRTNAPRDWYERLQHVEPLELLHPVRLSNVRYAGHHYRHRERTGEHLRFGPERE